MKQHGNVLAFFHERDIPSHRYRCEFTYRGLVFNHVEKFMMVAKAKLFNDEAVASRILAADHPGDCKALGRQVAGFDQAVWDKYKYPIIVKGNREKFQQNPGLARFLIDTDPYILVEGSPYDRIYGVGLHVHDPTIGDPANWKGLNLCGKAVMAVRDALRAACNDAAGIVTCPGGPTAPDKIVG